MVISGCATEQTNKVANPQPCTANSSEDGSIILTCPGSDPVNIRNGIDGEEGIPGNNGTNGSPCSVTDNNDGSVTIDCPDGTTVTYNVPLCGNGEVEAGEECDDANADNSDACLSTCMDASCGDGYIGPNEYCDSNLLGDYQCDPTCGGFICEADFEISSDEEIINLDGCSHVVGSLSITGTTLQEFTGLDRLQKITSNLVIKDNASLLNLDGITNLVSVENALEIEGNTALESLVGLNNVLEVDYLTVKNNPVLPTCQAEELRDLLGEETLLGIVIYGNDDTAICE